MRLIQTFGDMISQNPFPLITEINMYELLYYKLVLVRMQNPDQLSVHVLFYRGIPTVPGTVCLKKDANNLIGISIGGGAQYCPCLYIVQVCTHQLI